MFAKNIFAIYAKTILVLYFLAQVEISSATTYNVGDSKGWEWDVTMWSTGKTFKVGDVLVFKYDTSLHTVGIVKDKASYDKCILSRIVKEYKSGNDQITLTKGYNYFICGTVGHCNAGVRLAVLAL